MVEAVYKRQPRTCLFSFPADRGSEPEAKTSPLMSRSQRSLLATADDHSHRCPFPAKLLSSYISLKIAFYPQI